MNQVKSAAVTALGVFVALAVLGVFATFGLAFIGISALLSLVGLVVVGAVTLFSPKQDAVAVEA